MQFRNIFYRLAISFVLASMTASYAAAQEQKVDEQTRAQLKTIMAHLLEDVYVSPEVGKDLAGQLRAKFESGVYDKAAAPAELAELLSRDLREFGKDRHLYVRYDATRLGGETILTPEAWSKMRGTMFPKQSDAARVRAPEMDQRMATQLQQANYHFRQAKYLDGNIGYLDLGGFAGGEAALETAAKTMAQLTNSEAMIIDLRVCPGGSPEMINFLASYFFDKEPRVLMNRFMRPTGETIQSKTLAEIPGKRMTDIDLYLLVSSRTGSACESFPYTLQQWGRAKVIGERTAGAGHNNAIIPLGKGYSFSVSYGRPIHPRSGKGWEREGVQPDIAVPADSALETAQKEALQKLIAKTTNPTRKKELESALQSLSAKVTSASSFKDYLGKYGNKEITIKDGELFYQRIGGRGAALRATAKDKFALNNDAQITFIRDARSVVTEMVIDWVEREKEQLKREAPATP